MSTQVSVQIHELPKAAAPAAEQTQVKAGARLLYVDNLRVFLTILVVIHHLAITYGASGGWFYYERPSTLPAEILLTLFTTLNQFYFMGLFFLIAGYFVPGAVDRKGSASFLKDRLVRLGIPLILFTLLISPFLVYINGKYDGWFSGTLQEFLAGYYQRTEFTTGPLWFVEALLLFSAVYVLGRAIINWLKRHSQKPASLPVHKPLSHSRILAAILLLAPASVAARLFFPIDTTWHNWQLAFFPQYILLFSTGILAYRQDWLNEIPEKVSKIWSRVALAAMAILPVIMISLFITDPANLEKGKSGLNFLSVLTASWEAVYCLSMPILLFSIFRKRFNIQNRLSRFLSQNAYTVYIIHAPVIVFTALLFRNVTLDPLLKYALVAPLAVSVTFLTSHTLVRRLPQADRVL
jgi:peptidoglycan/LPS O-acetylase OafA/YrhL